jgi:hypothetical protein
MGLLGYDFSRKFTLLAGYRALALDQEEGSGNNKHDFPGARPIPLGVLSRQAVRYLDFIERN